MKYFVKTGCPGGCAGRCDEGGVLEGVNAGVLGAVGAVAELGGDELGAAVGAVRFVATSTTTAMIKTTRTTTAILKIIVRGLAGLIDQRYAV